MNKKAIVIGINNYVSSPLSCCVNDANEVEVVLKRDENGDKNFSVRKLVNENATKQNILESIENVFTDDCEIGLFYFSGHGCDDKNDGQIIAYNESNDYKIPFKQIIEKINNSKCKNRIVILDCCFSGKIGNYSFIGDQTILPCGTTILTACNKQEYAIEEDGHGVFTNLLLLALKGGAANIFGEVTPASIYSYIDSCLGDFEQRPLFKSHVNSFITLRKCNPSFSKYDMNKLVNLFSNYNSEYKLDPSYEPTNYLGSTEIGAKDCKPPFFNKEHGKIFTLLQKAVSCGLIRPKSESHMFYAAMNSDSCILTKLGQHYWIQSHKEII